MKRILTVIVAVLAVFCATEASAQLRYGIMAGANFNKASVKLEDYKNGKYMTGFQIGPVMEYEINLGVASLGVEGGVLFTQKGVKFTDETTLGELGETVLGTFKSNYIEIPVNAKLYFVTGPAVRMFVKAGPSFNFNISKKEVLRDVDGHSVALPGYERSAFNLSLNAGLGVEVLRMLQISASYSASMLPDYKYESVGKSWKDFLNTKNKGFVITAAVLF